jgi:hypothetical protein
VSDDTNFSIELFKLNSWEDVWNEWYAITIVISLIRKLLLNRNSFFTHRLLFASTNQYFCTIVLLQLEVILIDFFDRLTSDYCSVNQSSDIFTTFISSISAATVAEITLFSTRSRDCSSDSMSHLFRIRSSHVRSYLNSSFWIDDNCERNNRIFRNCNNWWSSFYFLMIE